MKTLVAILTSDKLDKLTRCIQSAANQTDTENIVVIINTQDPEYAKHAVQLTESCNIKSVITESNGKPGKGKNSLISYFLSTDFTHVIPVDGDDYLLPRAVDIIEYVAETKQADVIGLIDGIAVLNDVYMSAEDWFYTDAYHSRMSESIEKQSFRKFNVHMEKIRRVSTEYGNFFNRLVLVSRVAADKIHYEEDMGGAEDVRQSLLLKLAHRNNLLSYVLLSSQNVYMYDVSEPGVVLQVACRCDPEQEKKLFWKDLSADEINSLKSFQLERIDDRNRFPS